MLEKLKIELPRNQENTMPSARPRFDRFAELAYAVEKNRLGLPRRFKDKTILDFKWPQGIVSENVLQAIKRGESLFITGSCGTGKTHLACAIAYEIYLNDSESLAMEANEYQQFKKPTIPLFLPAVELFLELQATFNSKSNSEDDVIDYYGNQKILIVDDIGSEKISDWSRSRFYALIDRRYRNMMQTIVTSNLGLQKIAELIDDRIASRFTEMGTVVKLTGTDRRLIK